MMEFHLLLVFSLISLLLSAATEASLPAEDYWKSVLPNTQFPKALESVLQQSGKYYKDKTNEMNDAKHDLLKEHYVINLDYKDKTKEMNDAKHDLLKEHYVINLDYKESKNTFSDDGKVINNWMDAAKGDFSSVATFYSPGDLYPGRRMKLHFRNVGSRVGFLPREIAKSIPFSSDQIPEILNHFAIKAGSEEAKSIADVLDLCEGPKMEGEEKFCPASLESMIDFAVARLGEIGMVLTTQPGKKQEYIVLKEAKRMGEKALVCHKTVYPYALYYCHEMQGTKAYTVPLLGADGSRITVVTVCHEDTSAWNPKELAFQLLKAKPGMTICHFLANDILVWVPPKDPGHKFVNSLSMDQ